MANPSAFHQTPEPQGSDSDWGSVSAPRGTRRVQRVGRSSALTLRLKPTATPSVRMIIRCCWERWLKDVNASNAGVPSGGCKILNGRFDYSGTEIRLRWRANVNQPSMQLARPLHAGGRRARELY